MTQPTPANGTAPSPAMFFDAVTAYQRSEVLRAAVELDVFSAIGEGNRSVPDLARRCGAAERGVRILCDYLVATGFLTKDAQGYGLTPDSAVFLDRRSPAYMGNITEFMLSPEITGGFRLAADAVRRGGTAVSSEGTTSAENPVWVKFARAMASAMTAPAERTAELVDPSATVPIKVLDVAAGHGVFGLAFARRNPRAHVTALDWANVLEVAKENAAAAGLADRFATIAGSAFDADLGGPYDVVLLPNFLHHFDPATNEGLLRKVRDALADGGRAVTVEFIPNDGRVSPAPAATFAMVMLATTPRGDAYTFAEYEAMFRIAGFARSEIHELPPTMQRVVVSTR